MLALPRRILDPALAWIGHRAQPLSAISQGTRAVGAPLARAIRAMTSATESDPGSAHPEQAIFPLVRARLAHQVVVHAQACALSLADRILIPDHLFAARARNDLRGGHLRQANQHLGVVDLRTTVAIDQGIALFGARSIDWYRWLIEILPTAYLARQLGRGTAALPLLVPPECAQSGRYRDSLALFLDRRPVLTLHPDRPYSIVNLLLIDPLAHSPVRLKTGLRPQASDHLLHPEALLQFRQAILDAIVDPSTRDQRRVYLVTGESTAGRDQSELITIARDEGLDIVALEHLSFADRVLLFHTSGLLVGPSSPDWADLLFAAAGTRGLIWSAPGDAELGRYTTLARAVGADLRVHAHRGRLSAAVFRTLLRERIVASRLTRVAHPLSAMAAR
jgi:capsular polysaccharide biosynthesis protein